MERALREMGITGGVLGLREYYESSVIDYHRWLLKDCVALRGEYAASIAVKVGYESKSDKPSSNSLTTSLVTSPIVGSRSESSKHKLSLTNSSSSAVTPGNRFVWLSKEPFGLSSLACFSKLTYCILDLCLSSSLSSSPSCLGRGQLTQSRPLIHTLPPRLDWDTFLE
jgi:hypothetical protein